MRWGASKSSWSSTIAALLHQKLTRTVTVCVDGSVKQISYQEFLVEKIFADALRGNPRGAKFIAELLSSLPPPAEGPTHFSWTEEQEKLFRRIEEVRFAAEEDDAADDDPSATPARKVAGGTTP